MVEFESDVRWSQMTEGISSESREGCFDKMLVKEGTMSRWKKEGKKSSVTQNTVVAHAEVHRNSTCTLFHSFSRPHRFSPWVDHWSRGFFYSTLPNALLDSKSESLLSAARVSHELVSCYHTWFFYKFRYSSNVKLKKRKKKEMKKKRKKND